MLPNFTVVTCGAILTVLMLVVAGSGLIDPQTRIGAMPEIGRPMIQRMIAEPPARGQFAALEVSRRAEELRRLRDLAPVVSDPAAVGERNASVQPATESPASEAAAREVAAPESAAPAPSLPSNAAAPASTEIVPTVAEAAPAAVAPPPARTEAAPTVATEAVQAAIVEPTPAAAAKAAPAQDTAGAPAPNDAKLAAPSAGETPPAAPSIAPPTAAPENVATASPTETPAVEERGRLGAEPPAPQQLALAELDAVPAPEPAAKLAARTGEPEEAAPVRRAMPRFVPLLPRITLMRHPPLQARLVPSAPRIAPMLVHRLHAKSKAEAARPDAAKAVVSPRKPMRHVVRPVQHRAQRAAAPSNAVSAYPTYSASSGVQNR
jgi:hypothetical protein